MAVRNSHERTARHPSLLWRRWRHHLEIRDVGSRHVPRGLAPDVDNALRFEPVAVVNRTRRDPDEARTRRVLAVDPSAARWTEVARVDVAAVGLDRKTPSVPIDLEVLALEERQRHVPSARGSLAVLAVALARANGLTTKRENDRAAKAATRSKGLLSHGMTFQMLERHCVLLAR